ncbi:conserved hypothetical protein [Ricinus communis]|uniref:Uncharacterized protein n=1 Tax=Ricinus communis TaxID=3988 RepID=B9RTD7_RICCO|nr:conserved hypothetical protein [Ricinus communis]
MEINKRIHFTNSFKFFTILFTITTPLQLGEAIRTSHGEQWLTNNFLNSLKKGPVPPSSSSPCTYIPVGGSGHCPTLSGMNFAGRLDHRAPPRPTAATFTSDIQRSDMQNPSS